MINAHHELTAIGRTANTSGVLNNLSQLPIQLPRNMGAGGDIEEMLDAAGPLGDG
ncbi:hypothetical protein [Streptomyces sp. NPDC048638]|uniref:hypothetical protein n=1 Tax=Streptomyces sp. NPDC048638 TaxID=3365580 RepID=UPI00371EBFCE